MVFEPSRRLGLVVLTALPLAFGASVGTARADGALAVGLPESGAQDGFSYGYAVGYEAGEAEAQAMGSCRKNSGGAERAVLRLCRIVETFQGRCVAVAMDPKDGTPGVGWAVDDDETAAQAAAIAACHETAGEGRRLFCRIDASACDDGERSAN